MSSHPPYASRRSSAKAEKEEEAAAPTAPAGKHRSHHTPRATTTAAAATAPAGKRSAHQAADNDHDATAAAAALSSPSDTHPQQQQQKAEHQNAQGSQAVGYAVPLAVEAAAAPPARTVVESTEYGPAAAAATTTTRVVTLQPCKIVYYYADNTSHTYVLEGSSTQQQQQQQQQLTAPAAATSPPRTQRATGPAAPAFSDETSDVDGKAESEALLLTTAVAKRCDACGNCQCLASVYKPPEYAADITPGNPRIGSPGPVTLFAFGFTTCLYNVHQAGLCPMNLTTMGLICFYGGLAQFVGGFFELVNKNTIFCTLDVTYGAFWMATALANLVPENDKVVSSVPNTYMGGFFMLWFFFASTMFASSFKFSYVQMLLNFSVSLNFFLNFLGSFIGSATLLRVAGFEGIVEGCLATYVGMAFTMRDVYGHSVLPLFFQKNFKITEW